MYILFYTVYVKVPDEKTNQFSAEFFTKRYFGKN